MPAELRLIPTNCLSPKDMNDREWAAFLSKGRADFYRGGQAAFDDGIGFFIGEDDGLFKFSIGDSAGNKVTWDGLTLTIVGDLVIAADNFIRSGQTAYNTGVGFWLGSDGGVPMFSIGDSAGSSLTWDGVELRITDVEGVERTIDNLRFKGDSNTHPAVGQLIGSTVATTNPTAVESWQTLRTIETDFTGSFRLRVEARRIDTVGAPPQDGGWRLKNGIGTIVHTEAFSSTIFADAFSGEELITEAGESWTLEGRSASDLATWTLDTEIRDVEVRARLDHATIT